jgi:hypothetical protein
VRKEQRKKPKLDEREIQIIKPELKRNFSSGKLRRLVGQSMKNNTTKTSKKLQKSPEFLSIADEQFSRIEHYKDRQTVWIKLYLDLLNDFEFCQLPDETKWHLVGLMMLAVNMNNRLRNNIPFLMQKISANSEINLEILLASGFIVPYKRLRTKKLIASTDKDIKVDVDKEESEKKEREKIEEGEIMCVPQSDFSKRKSIHSPETPDSYYVACEDNGMEIRNPPGFRNYIDSGAEDERVSAWLERGDDVFLYGESFDDVIHF